MNYEITKYFMFFIIYSFLGWILETTYKSIKAKKFINSGFLNGPFCPIYGFGAIIMLITMDKYKNNDLLLFFAGVIILTIWEYIVGVYLEKHYKTKYWDYKDQVFNINGRVCLKTSLCWGVLALIFIKYIHMHILTVVDILPSNILVILNVILLAGIVIDMITSEMKIVSINKSMDNLTETGEKIREKFEELKSINEANKLKNKVYIENAIKDLKQYQMELKTKIEKRTKRLFKVFPNMTSKRIKDFLNENKKTKNDL